jgi:opacity protein-like surface antigen
MKIIFAAATAAAAFCAVSGAAQAQTAPVGVYGTLGYADAHSNSTDLGVIQGRLGYRIMPYAGVEGEAAFGIKKDDVDVQTGLGDINGRAELKHEFAAYGVGFLPVTPNADLLARVGYGTTRVKVSVPTQTVGGVTIPASSASDNQDSWNFGVGGQYHFDDKNGVRVDYTRQEFTKDSYGHADVYSIAYTRRF